MDIVSNATKWVEQNQSLICLLGRTLTLEEQIIASHVGVATPEQVHVYEVPVIKPPNDPVLAASCEQFGFLTANTIGLTLGYGIYIKQGYLTTRLLSHELRHVYQYEQAGSTEMFLSRYISEIMKFDYENAPYELDARSHELRNT